MGEIPELPEVETVRRSLTELVVGKTVKDVKVDWPKMVKHPLEIEQFQDALSGQQIVDVDRRGKFLIFLLDDYALVSHLRMEGHYRLYKEDDAIDKHTHVTFRFTDGTEMRYLDVRKFGTMHLFSKGTERDLLPLAKLGPEPFSKQFTKHYLAKRLQRTTRIIKAVLLDQTVVVGIGNIYADEVLFRSKIHPERRANKLTKEEISKLHIEIIQTLKESVLAGGSSVNSYMDAHGMSGTYQEQLVVYGRNGERCNTCGSLLEKIKAAGRGTHFCPTCQTK